MPPPPLNIYISHAPEDKKHLAAMLPWLEKLKQQYGVRVWYNNPLPPPKPTPLPWRILFFWVEWPKPTSLPWHPDIQERVGKSHIYLFILSIKSVNTGWIDEREVVPAVNRYTRLGPSRIRIFPVLAPPVPWEKYSRLSGFKPIGKVGSDDDYMSMMKLLEAVIVDMLRLQNERLQLQSKARGGAPSLDADDVFLPEGDDRLTPPPTPARPKEFPLPEWMGWSIIIVIVWLTYLGFEPYLPSKPFRPRYAEPAYKKPEEYLRTLPPLPPPQDLPLLDTTEYPQLPRPGQRLEGIEYE